MKSLDSNSPLFNKVSLTITKWAGGPVYKANRLFHQLIFKGHAIHGEYAVICIHKKIRELSMTDTCSILPTK